MRERVCARSLSFMAAAVTSDLVVRVFVELALSTTQQTELVEACSNIVIEGCVIATEDDDSARRGRVSDAGDAGVRVTVTTPDRTRTTTLAFREGDAPLERARAIGIVVGILSAGETQIEQPSGVDEDSASAATTPGAEDGVTPSDEDRERSETEVASEPSEASRVASDPRTTPTKVGGADASRKGADVSLAAGIYGNAAYDPGLGMGGVGIAGRLFVMPGDAWLASASFAFLVWPRQGVPMRMTEISPTVGLGHSWTLLGLRFLPTLELGAKHWSVRSVSPAPLGQDGRWSPLLRATPLVGVDLGAHGSLHLAPQVEWIFSRTTVVMGQEAVGREDAIRVSILIGGAILTGADR